MNENAQFASLLSFGDAQTLAQFQAEVFTCLPWAARQEMLEEFHMLNKALYLNGAGEAARQET